MIKTIVILILTIIVVPFISYRFGTPLSPLQHEILWNCIYIFLFTALACFSLSELTGNCSQVDKIWSIIPIVYAWHIAYAGAWSDRLILMAILVTIWGIRLTYNFSRRGAYSWKIWDGEEDYRWAVLRKKPELSGKLKWTLFNLFFISLYQNGLILLFTLPILVTVNEGASPLGITDYLLAFLFIGFVVLETIADQQQWNYQNEKHRQIKLTGKAEGIFSKGFTHTGLWKYMRHPNYLAEQAIWICFYFLGANATGEWINWSVAGCMLLLVLFQGSSDFSEAISAEKYPDYKEYMKKTGRFLPKWGV
jgi:steroid 5-alpha reductase family enzyme